MRLSIAALISQKKDGNLRESSCALPTAYNVTLCPRHQKNLPRHCPCFKYQVSPSTIPKLESVSVTSGICLVSVLGVGTAIMLAIPSLVQYLMLQDDYFNNIHSFLFEKYTLPIISQQYHTNQLYPIVENLFPKNTFCSDYATFSFRELHE